MTNSLDDLDPTELAVRRRLRRLSTFSVDTTRLDARLGTSLGIGPTRSTYVLGRYWRQLSAVAASAAVLLTVVLVLLLGSRPLHAEPGVMARLHADIVSGQIPMTRVGSVHEATELVRRDWPDAPGLPSLPADHDLACCLKDFAGRRVVCLLFEDDGTPISVVVASRDSLRPGSHRSAAVVHTAGEVNMVMKEREGRFVCIMGRVPASRLMQLAEALEF